VYILTLFSGVDDNRLIDYIHEAGLDNLYERTGGLDCPVTWNWYVLDFYILLEICVTVYTKYISNK
jgi:hypothetical protein